MIKNKVVYLAGPITNCPEYKENFLIIEAGALNSGARVVINPAVLPFGLTHAAYMRICLVMVREADCLLMLPNWQQSKGACMEHLRAIDLGISIYETDYSNPSQPLSLRQLYRGAA